MSNRLLVIGGSTEHGIGEAIAKRAEELPHYFKTVDVPTPSEWDVRVGWAAYDYLHKRPPYTHIVYAAGVASLDWIGGKSEWASVFDVNVFGFLRLLDEIVQLGGFDKTRRVLAISSDAATVPMRGSIGYCSSKAALSMAVRCAARELAPHIIVNAIAPAMVEGTAMTKYIDRELPEFRGWTRDEAADYERSLIPMGRRATVDEVAMVALDVLLGPEFLTGAIVPITGGK